ncbi:MAG: alpha/beta hydrolase [Alphaproteobacteria bacterium]|nr:alpha/beta hydrolase [Alphaproteobacteria bacterium]
MAAQTLACEGLALAHSRVWRQHGFQSRVWHPVQAFDLAQGLLMKMPIMRVWACFVGLLLAAALFAQPAVAANRTMSINGLNYFVRDSGGDGPVVLMLHGQPDDGSIWDAQAAGLAAAGYRVLVPDLVGYGRTDRPKKLDRYKTTSVATDMGRMLDQLGIKGPVHLVAHDWGVDVAWDFYYGQPGRTRSMAILAVGYSGAFAKESLSFEHSRWNWFLFLQKLPRAANLYRANNGMFLRETLLRSHPHRDAVVAKLLKPGGVEAMLSWDRANSVVDAYLAAISGAYDKLPKVNVPVLGIAGSDDCFLWPSQVKNTRAYVSGRFEYTEIKGGSHWMMLDHPQEVTQRLKVWLNSQPR